MTVALDLPVNRNGAAGSGKRTVLGRIRGQFVQGQGERRNGLLGQDDARPTEADVGTVERGECFGDNRAQVRRTPAFLFRMSWAVDKA